MAAKVVPGIDPALVAIVPMKTNRITANGRDYFRPGRFFVHLQQTRRLWLRLARLAPVSPALLMTSCTRASIAQPGEGPMALMPILPVDLHSGPSRLLDPDSRRFRGLARQIPHISSQPGCLVFADETNSFVAHFSSILFPEKVCSHSKPNHHHQRAHELRVHLPRITRPEVSANGGG
jgi:hypothetical protein